MSRKPGPCNHDPFSPFLPAQTPGPLGCGDRADPNVHAHPGDTPCSLGINDHAHHMATGWARSGSAHRGPSGVMGIAAYMSTQMILAATPQTGAPTGGLLVY